MTRPEKILSPRRSVQSYVVTASACSLPSEVSAWPRSIDCPPQQLKRWISLLNGHHSAPASTLAFTDVQLSSLLPRLPSIFSRDAASFDNELYIDIGADRPRIHKVRRPVTNRPHAANSAASLVSIEHITKSDSVRRLTGRWLLSLECITDWD